MSAERRRMKAIKRREWCRLLLWLKTMSDAERARLLDAIGSIQADLREGHDQRWPA